jgi:uncharacterized protein (TIGR04145 family)
MSSLLKVILLSLTLVGVPAGYVFYSAVVSPNDWVYEGHGNWADAGTHGSYRGAPGPLMGAGLPLLVAAGGVWLYRRRRQKNTG